MEWQQGQKEIGNGFQLFYIGEDGMRYEIGIIINDETKRGVLVVI